VTASYAVFLVLAYLALRIAARTLPGLDDRSSADQEALLPSGDSRGG